MLDVNELVECALVLRLWTVRVFRDVTPRRKFLGKTLDSVDNEISFLFNFAPEMLQLGDLVLVVLTLSVNRDLVAQGAIAMDTHHW